LEEIETIELNVGSTTTMVELITVADCHQFVTSDAMLCLSTTACGILSEVEASNQIIIESKHICKVP